MYTSQTVSRASKTPKTDLRAASTLKWQAFAQTVRSIQGDKMTHVFSFADGDSKDKALLGGKGATLCDMTQLGLPVPAGFVITTRACREFSTGGDVPVGLWDEVRHHLARLERDTDKRLGDCENPLLVSVRSGAQCSMPGMMDTILNLGLNDRAVEGLARASGDERFAWDAYRRLIQMYADVVMDVPRKMFEHRLEALKLERGITCDSDLNADDLRNLCRTFMRLYRDQTGQEFPQDPWTQLEGAILAVFKSWNNKRAVTYRNLNGIAHDLGTAVNVQAMVFGNLGQDSGTGVGFTRNPNTGAGEVFGEFLINAQGEDVVAGIRTPQPLASLETILPKVYQQLLTLTTGLERRLKDMQDFEFTVERGRLFMLQTRSGKRTAQAAVRIAVDLANGGIINRSEALQRITPEMLERVLHPGLIADHGHVSFVQGLPASPGAATGAVVFSADEAAELGTSQPVILVTTETSPEDIHGMAVAQGILTARGGMTSHAAVVARGMGKPAIVGAERIQIDLQARTLTVGETIVGHLETITLDGSSGQVFAGEIPTVMPETGPEFHELLGWADRAKRLGVRANADTPSDAQRAREFGAQGIGLCRTEHMFFAEDRLPCVRQMILAESKNEETEALERLLEMQRQDFREILLSMDGLPVTIRLLDPPLHEFLPKLEDLAVRVANNQSSRTTGLQAEHDQLLLNRVRAMHEQNPMMGLRGIRLGITRPAIIQMQVRAIAQATSELLEKGFDPKPEIMIPLVGSAAEFALARAIVEEVIQEVQNELSPQVGMRLEIPIGTMIELPRACLVAAEIAKLADFFSFGTNDLTQMTYGFSRDDAQGKFIPEYLERQVLDFDPFATIDTVGVGALVRMAFEAARRVKPTLKIGVCGEHGGDPASIAFFNGLGLDSVSCSPYRLPVARLMAARVMNTLAKTDASSERSSI
jgi:pyruvate, orthophosphate dikinase